MSQFWLYFQFGFDHVLSWNAFEHVLFLIVLVVNYSFTNWLRVLWLVTIFTLAHFTALAMGVNGLIAVSRSWIELLIGLTIFALALYNIFTAKKKEGQKNINLLYFITAFFGLIHGLGYASHFRSFSSGIESKFLPLLEFTLGVEVAHITAGLVIMILGFIFQNFLRVTRRDWILIISAIVIGIILPILRKNIQIFF